MENKYASWIIRFGSLLDDHLGGETRQKVLDQCNMYQEISNNKDMAHCVKEVMVQFDHVVPEKEKRYGIMEEMGKMCFKKYLVKTAESVKKKSNNIVEITQNLNILTGGEYYKLKDNKVYATFNQCVCPIGVKETEKLISKTYCNCSLGWMKSLFKTLLDKSVKVELIESIISGGKTCQFVIHYGDSMEV